jgi:ribosomal protein S27AE
MYLTYILSAHSREDLTTCPECGSCSYDDNRLDERLYAEAVRTEAPLLRFEGRSDEAIGLLTALYAIRITNFIRHQWLCNDCGVTFDA